MNLSNSYAEGLQKHSSMFGNRAVDDEAQLIRGLAVEKAIFQELR